MRDDEYELTARALLGQSLQAEDGAVCQNRRASGASIGQICGAAMCRSGLHSYNCCIGGGVKARSNAIVKVVADIHKECGCNVATEVYVTAWDRWRWRCLNGACEQHGVADAPRETCEHCSAALEVTREEAVLDIEVRSPIMPIQYIDVTVHHSLPGDDSRLGRAAQRGGEVAREAARQKHERYPRRRCQWALRPFAVETFGAFGKEAVDHVRKLARTAATSISADLGVVSSVLVQKWSARLSVALQMAGAPDDLLTAGLAD